MGLQEVFSDAFIYYLNIKHVKSWLNLSSKSQWSRFLIPYIFIFDNQKQIHV